MPGAYVFIEVNPSATQAVLGRLGQLSKIRVHEVLGPFDIIVELDDFSQEEITRIVRREILPIEGITNTVTCTWMD